MMVRMCNSTSAPVSVCLFVRFFSSVKEEKPLDIHLEHSPLASVSCLLDGRTKQSCRGLE